MSALSEELNFFIEWAWKLNTPDVYEEWHRRLLAFLSGFGEQQPLIDQLQSLRGYSEVQWKEYRDRQASHLLGHVARLQDREQDPSIVDSRLSKQTLASVLNSTKVFLVHGHDSSAKESTARFLEKLSLDVVILHEQPSEGRTVIEKFEDHSDVGFAVVLLTPDDVGAASTHRERLSSRARQNVILELGYFTGKLGRQRVCGLHKPGVELPSDLHGVLFIELDSQGGWKTKLAQELVTSGMKIDLQGLLHN